MVMHSHAAEFGGVIAYLALVAACTLPFFFLWAKPVAGSGGLLDDEKLLYSQGDWHRLQRKRVPFQAACYYTHEIELPYGCQYSASKQGDWRENGVRAKERSALASFWDATNGKNWRSSDNWGTGDPCWDSWYGVTCDEHGHVIALELVDNSLHGTLPQDFGDLESLLKIDLSTTASQYHNHPNLYVNRLTGTVPSLQKITRLEELVLSGNDFDALPQDLFLNGPSLRVLTASYNRLRVMPKYLNRYVSLHTMELDHNQIEGTLGPDLGLMFNMRYLHLDYNLLGGPMPSTISQLTKIRTFDVSHNTLLRSEITEDVIVNWAEVEYLAILNTSISGYISALCLDVPFCWKYMLDTHKDLTWATADEVPDVVNLTIELAKRNPNGPQWGSGSPTREQNDATAASR